MDLGTTALFDLSATGAGQVEEPAVVEPSQTRSQQLLAEIVDDQRVITEREIAKVRRIAEWAAEHVVTAQADASTLTERGLDTGLPLAGQGAPLISDFAVMELAAVLGRTLDSGRSHVGQVVELAHRLPRIWARVLNGEVPVWKALRIADHTRSLNLSAAGFVDRQLATFAAGCSWAQIDRLLDEAITRFDPDLAEERRTKASEHRHLDIRLDAACTDGVVQVEGTLDLADALDLEEATRRTARHLGDLGCTETLDVRRSMALGEIARTQLALDLDTGEVTQATGGTGRKVELFVHLTDTALSGTDSVGRLGNTRIPVTAEQIRRWCGTAGTILVRPVLDLAGCEPIGAYEIPDRLARQVRLRDQHCVHPHCTRPAESCDIDHVQPHREGGPTCACNTAPLCRGHHRLKTARRATYQVLTPAVYLWTSHNTGHRWLVSPAGTHALVPRAHPPED